MKNGWKDITEEDGTTYCYYKSDEPINYLDAYINCALKGGDLVSTQSEHQQTLILSA